LPPDDCAQAVGAIRNARAMQSATPNDLLIHTPSSMTCPRDV
jgi:hypothetical protein